MSISHQSDLLIRLPIVFATLSWFSQIEAPTCWSNPPGSPRLAVDESNGAQSNRFDDRANQAQNQAQNRAQNRAALGVVVVDSPGVGVLVTAVQAKSPAEVAAIVSGDFIVALDGEAVDDPVELAKLIRAKSVGSQVAVGVWRDGQQTTKQVRLAANQLTVPNADRARLGVRLDPNDARGPRVAAVAPGGPAALAEIRAGDLITAIDGQPVRTISELVEAINRRQAGATITVTVDRAGGGSEVKVELGSDSDTPFSSFRIPFGFDDEFFPRPNDFRGPGLPARKWDRSPIDPSPWRKEIEQLQEKMQEQMRKHQESADKPASTEQVRR